MLERFTDRARQVVVLAQEEARRLDHNYIGTEHILLGLIRESEGIPARVLASLAIGLDAVRQRVEELIGRGQQAAPGHIPFTPRSKKVLELSLRESSQLGHSCIGPEHILLGLIREGDGVAAQVLVMLGADLNQVRLQVSRLMQEPVDLPVAPEPGVTARLEMIEQQLAAIESQLTAIERRVGIGRDTADLDEQVEDAIGAQDLTQAAAEVERLRALLRQHGIDPEDKPA